METFENRSVWDQPACTSLSCPSHLPLQSGSTRGEAKHHCTQPMCQEPSQQFHCPKNPPLSYKKGEAEAHAVPVGRERVKLGIGAPAWALSRHSDRLFTRSFLLGASLQPQSQKFPRLNRINIPMAKERRVPQRRYNHVAPAEAAQAYETEHGAEGLDLGPGQPPSHSPQLYSAQEGHSSLTPQLYPTRQLETQQSPGRGTGSNLDSGESCRCFWVSACCVHPEVESWLQKECSLRPCEKQHRLCFLAP